MSNNGTIGGYVARSLGEGLAVLCTAAISA